MAADVTAGRAAALLSLLMNTPSEGRATMSCFCPNRGRRSRAASIGFFLVAIAALSSIARPSAVAAFSVGGGATSASRIHVVHVRGVDSRLSAKRRTVSCPIETENEEKDRRPATTTTNAATTRREAIISASMVASALLLTAASPQASSADGALESMDVGTGSWYGKQSNANSSASSPVGSPSESINNGGVSGGVGAEARFVPPVFATYLARFLLKYDTGASSWWSSIKTKYSLLSTDERQQKLDETFGKFAKSVAVGIESYVQGTADTFDVDPSIRSTSSDAESRTMVRSRLTGVSISVSEKYAQIANTFALRYTDTDVVSVEQGREISRQIALLFATLPPQYQPLSVMEQLVQVGSGSAGSGPAAVVLPRDMNWDVKKGIGFVRDLGLPEGMRVDYDSLLPVMYSAIPYMTDASKSAKTSDSSSSGAIAYTISPPLSLVSKSIGRGPKATVSTPFGPLSSAPLTRDKPATVQTYAKYGLSGAAGCALTHTVVVPLDVVKTRLQTDPDRYEGIFDGARTIVEEEGWSAFGLGLQATIAGYFWYGLSVYPSYSFFKYAASTWLLNPDVAAANSVAISLLAGALSAVLASLGLTPCEAARIRTVAEPDRYTPLGFTGTLAAIASEDRVDGSSESSEGFMQSLGLATLYAGLPSLMARQVIFGSVKFLSYERACDMIYAIWPFLRDGTATALAVSLVAGGLAGSLSSFISQPADSVLTYVAMQPTGEGGRQMGLLEGARVMVEKGGVSSLFNGLGSRCLWAGSIIAGQFFLYDIFRGAFGVTAEDLTQVWYLRL